MKLKLISFLVLLTGALSIYTFLEVDTGLHTPRTPASIPSNYESLKGCEKQDLLWDKIQSTVHHELPEFQKFGLMQLLAMGRQEMKIKGDLHSDFSPEGWKKYLHRRGAIAKVKIVPKKNKYTGVFQGAECALLRLSLTYKTAGKKPVAPGLAFKVLRDGVHSANISALVSLDGQGKEFNFFKNPMSNIVPTGFSFGQKMVHKIFRRASNYPEELSANDMALIDSMGQKSKSLVAPRQMFFVPNGNFNFSSEEHDVRDDFLNIPAGTIVYQIFVLNDKYLDFNYADYDPEKASRFLKESEHVADIITTSEFIASDFGDDGMFFRHQLRP